MPASPAPGARPAADPVGRPIEICHGPRCGDYGGKALLAELRERGIDATAVDCRSLCPHSPVARLENRCLLRASAADVCNALAAAPLPDPW